jgi:deferrochelatase/peroxidase EfeB
MNPRDTNMEVLADVSLHRIIRRGTTFGPPYDPNAMSEADDEIERGAYFIFLGGRAMDTIEFLQKEWINDGNFMSLSDERDPIIGLQEQPGTFTIPKDRVRRRVQPR